MPLRWLTVLTCDVCSFFCFGFEMTVCTGFRLRDGRRAWAWRRSGERPRPAHKNSLDGQELAETLYKLQPPNRPLRTTDNPDQAVSPQPPGGSHEQTNSAALVPSRRARTISRAGASTRAHMISWTQGRILYNQPPRCIVLRGLVGILYRVRPATAVLVLLGAFAKRGCA